MTSPSDIMLNPSGACCPRYGSHDSFLACDCEDSRS